MSEECKYHALIALCFAGSAWWLSTLYWIITQVLHISVMS